MVPPTASQRRPAMVALDFPSAIGFPVCIWSRLRTVLRRWLVSAPVMMVVCARSSIEGEEALGAGSRLLHAIEQKLSSRHPNRGAFGRHPEDTRSLKCPLLPSHLLEARCQANALLLAFCEAPNSYQMPTASCMWSTYHPSHCNS